MSRLCKSKPQPSLLYRPVMGAMQIIGCRARRFSSSQSECSALAQQTPRSDCGLEGQRALVSEAFMIFPSFLGLFKSSFTMVREGLPSKC